MANEVNDSNDKVEQLNRGDRTSENTAESGVINGKHKKNQDIHKEASTAGHNFDTFSGGKDDKDKLGQKPGETPEQHQERLRRLHEAEIQAKTKPSVMPLQIDMGDGTFETARGRIDKGQEVLEAAKALKPSSPDSISLGGQNYEKDQLIAANLTPTNPVRSDATLPDLNNINDSKLPNDTLAWDPVKDIKDGLKSTGEKVYFVHRDKLDKFYDFEAARSISQKLPGLASYSERHNGIAPRLVRAIMRNEQTYYGADDAIIDGVVKHTGDGIKKVRNITAGPGQVSLSNINHLAEKYPEIFNKKTGSELAQLSTDPFVATLLVGAYIDDRIGKFEDWKKQEPKDPSKLSRDDRLLYRNAFPLWKAGLETKALIMSFNPGGGRQDHMNNVLKQLELIDQNKQ